MKKVIDAIPFDIPQFSMIRPSKHLIFHDLTPQNTSSFYDSTVQTPHFHDLTPENTSSFISCISLP